MDLLVPLGDLSLLIDPNTSVPDFLTGNGRFMDAYIDGEIMGLGFFLNAFNEKALLDRLNQ